MNDGPVQNARIYYFSGTGNAQWISQWMAASMQVHGTTVQLENIDKLRAQSNQTGPADLIGICAPTHGFNFPPVVLRFVMNFPQGKKQKVFICNTRAGMKAGRIFLPGLSGIALLLTALIMCLKGYRIVGLRPFDMPSNWISIHPGLKEKVARSIMLRCKTKAESFAQKMVSGKKDFRALYDIVQDLLIAPISLGYYMIGRFIFAKSFYADQHCTNCGLCIKNCPVNAIQMVEQRPYWTYQCESCMRCMNTCPERAIQTAHGFVFGVFYLVMVLFLNQLWAWLLQLNNLQLNQLIHHNWLRFTIESVVVLFFLLLAYRIMHSLLRFKWFEQLIRLTSLTSYRFWRRFYGKKYRFAPTTRDQQESVSG